MSESRLSTDPGIDGGQVGFDHVPDGREVPASMPEVRFGCGSGELHP